MKARVILAYWLLLLVPTGVISVSVFRLLQHERERLSGQAQTAAMDRAHAVADNLRLAVTDVQDELLLALRKLRNSDIQRTLVSWEQNNPLIRNVFVRAPGGDVLYPEEGKAATKEERGFLARYSALLSGRAEWAAAASDDGSVQEEQQGAVQAVNTRAQSDQQAAQQVMQQGAQGQYFQQVRKLKASRLELSNLADMEGVLDRTPTPVLGKDAGWIPWFTDNHVYLLGWVQDPESGLRYGVELEVMALLSRMVAALPSETGTGSTYVLFDSVGRIVHQSGETVVDDPARPDLALSLAPALPHWQLGVFFSPSTRPAAAGQSFFALSCLLLAIFVASILLGGSLLAWQAHRNMRDARQKTTFVSNVSHELKTPLTSIRMYAELLGEGRVSDQSKARHYLAVIGTESQRLARIVSNILDFSRLEQKHRKYNVEDIALRPFLEGLVDTHRLRLSEAQMSVNVSHGEDCPDVRADRDALEQAVLNLVDNAMKYASEGGEISIRTRRRGRSGRISVLDRGPGIPPGQRRRVFDKFHRVDDSLTAEKPGSGLGLSIARSLIRDQDGDLTYEPRDGGGSCFHIDLPLT